MEFARWSVVTFEYRHPGGLTGVWSTGQPLVLPRQGGNATSRQRLTTGSREHQPRPITQLFPFFYSLSRTNTPDTAPRVSNDTNCILDLDLSASDSPQTLAQPPWELEASQAPRSTTATAAVPTPGAALGTRTTATATTTSATPATAAKATATMDEDRAKAEKLAAAKKRVSSILSLLSRLRSPRSLTFFGRRLTGSW